MKRNCSNRKPVPSAPAAPPRTIRSGLACVALAALVPAAPPVADDAGSVRADAIREELHVVPQYQRHVFFDHSLSPDGYFFGTTDLIVPSPVPGLVYLPFQLASQLLSDAECARNGKYTKPGTGWSRIYRCGVFAW
jgi:hypothetical protein